MTEKELEEIRKDFKEKEQEIENLKALLIKADLRIVKDYRGREKIGTAIEWVPTDEEREILEQLSKDK